MTAGILTGCGKSDPSSGNRSEPQSAIGNQQSAILKFHWLGKKRLATESNATNFMAIWNLPESARLEAQTLDKLSTAPWRLLKTATPLSNAPTALLRPLLDDLVQEESYLEVRGDTNQPTELVLALRLPAYRAALWQTNLPAILRSLLPTSDFRPQTSESGISFQFPVAPKQSEAGQVAPKSDEGGSTNNYQLSLTRSGDWTLLSITGFHASARPSLLLEEFRKRLAANSTPFVPRATNYWFETEVDLPLGGKMLNYHSSWLSGIQRAAFTMVGDGANVRTHGEVLLSQPLKIGFDAWNIPTNLISDQLISFTAARLPDAPKFKSILNLDLSECTARGQIFVWALSSLPMATYAVVPVVAGSGCFSKVSQWLLSDANAWIETNAVGAFVSSEDGNNVTWQGAPFMAAYVQTMKSSSGELVLAGLVPTGLTNRAPNSELANRMMQRSNLVYYDWEFTGPRVESWFYLGQLGRVLFGRQQLPQDSKATAWLKAIAPKLGNAGTVIVMPESQRLLLDRFATFGLTAIELHLFADWLESANFPLGTHTTGAPARPLLRHKAAVPPPGN